MEELYDSDGMPCGVKKVISYGLSSYGYDARVADKFRVFTNVQNSLLDPKNLRDSSFVEIDRSDMQSL